MDNENDIDNIAIDCMERKKIYKKGKRKKKNEGRQKWFMNFCEILIS